MIVCHKFVFLHLHKSGGTFVNHLLMKCVPSARRIGYHLPYAEIPHDHRHLPVLGTVRNPWSYYVSWYHFQQGQTQPNALFRVCSENGTLDFDRTIRNLAGLSEAPERVERLRSVFPDHFVNHGLNLTRDCIGGISGSGLGFYSFLYNRLYAGAPQLRILRMEDLRSALPEALAVLRGPERMLAGEFLTAMPDLNVSQHGPYQSYYPSDLRDLIGRLERPVIEAFGYTFQPSQT